MSEIYTLPTITKQPIYTNIYRHGIDYRIPLKHKINTDLLEKQLRENYPELTYDKERNMIILVNYINTFARFNILPNDFKNNHFEKYESWKKLIYMKNISVPILQNHILKLLFLTSREKTVLNALLNDPEMVYCFSGNGNWYEFFMGSLNLRS
jgi:hypothetical protein